MLMKTLCKWCTENKLAYGIGGYGDVSDLGVSAKSAVLLVQREGLQ